MTDRKFEITDATGGAAFPVRVTTKAAEGEVVGEEDGILRVRLMASPAGDPSANQELISLLATYLQVDMNQIEIVAGVEGREKIVTIEGVNVNAINALLQGRQ